MPRIPIYDAPRVQSRPVSTPFVNGNHDTGLRELGAGVAQLGQGIDRAAQAQSAARRRAGQVDVNDQLAGLTRDADNGFYGAPDAMKTGEAAPGSWGMDTTTDTSAPAPVVRLKGKAAAAGSVEYLEYLDRRAQKRAELITDEEARAEYLSRSAMVVNDYRRKTEIHVGGQIEEAEKASQAAVVNSSLQAITASYQDEETVQTQFAIAEESLRKGALSKEDGDGKVLAFQQAAASARIEQFLADNDFAGATEVFKRSEAVIAPKDATRLRKAIADVRDDATAERTAQRFVDEARSEDTGWVDPYKVLSRLEAIPEGKDRDAVRQRLTHKVGVAQDERNKEISTNYSGAFTKYLKGGETLAAIPKGEKDWLIEHAPEKWRQLQNMAEEDEAERLRALKAGKKGGAGAKQADAQRLAFIELKADLAENPETYAKMSPAEFTAKWGGLLSRDDYERGGTLFVDTKKQDRVGSGDFSRAVKAETSTSEVLKNKKAATQFAADMGDRYRDFKAEKKREPTKAEVEEMRAEAWTKVVEKKSLFGTDNAVDDYLYPDAERYRFQEKRMPPAGGGALAAPAAKKISKYRKSPDGKKRVPVYEDGTYGPEEKVR